MTVPAGQHVLVTGAARGIGRCIARTLLERGHKVFLLDVLEDELRYCAETHLARYHPSQARYAVCDLRSVEAIRASVRQAAEGFFGGRIDAVVNNGGIASPKWKDGATMADPAVLDQWQAYVETNLTAPFALVQACIPYMKDESGGGQGKQGGTGPSVVLVGSFRAHQSDANQEGYAATKAGQLGLVHSMAVSCSQWGIRVNLVAPGRIKGTYECKEGDEKGTDWADLNEDKDADDHSANRAGRPEDIAEAVEYLMGAGFVTGQDITVDGGATKQKST